jgi:hypothetical protein
MVCSDCVTTRRRLGYDCVPKSSLDTARLLFMSYLPAATPLSLTAPQRFCQHFLLFMPQLLLFRHLPSPLSEQSVANVSAAVFKPQSGRYPSPSLDTLALALTGVTVPNLCPVIRSSGYEIQILPQPEAGCAAVFLQPSRWLSIGNQSASAFTLTRLNLTNGFYCVVARVTGYANNLAYAGSTANVALVSLPRT